MSHLFKESMDEVNENAKDIHNPKYIEEVLYQNQVNGQRVAIESRQNSTPQRIYPTQPR